jgi:hypothetical protein
MGHKFGPPQPANHLALIIVGAPSLNGKPVGNNRHYGAIDPRRNTGLRSSNAYDRCRRLFTQRMNGTFRCEVLSEFARNFGNNAFQ